MRWLIPALMLTGCFEDENAEYPHCDATETELAVDEVSPLGFSAADVLAFAEGTFDGELTWADDGSATGLVVAVASTGSVRFVDQEPVYPEGGESPAIGVVCDDYLAIDAGLGFVTADGAFDEEFAVDLVSLDGLGAMIDLSFDEDALAGSYSFDQRDPGTYDEIEHFLSVAIDAEGIGGSVEAQISGQDDECSGDECTAWAENIPVADF